MTDPVTDLQLEQAYAKILARPPQGREGCLSPEQLLALAAGTLAEGERVRYLRHVAACGACRPELDLLRAVTLAGRRPERRRLPLALAASVALIVAGAAVWRGVIGPGEELPVPRGGTGAPSLVAPLGQIRAAPRDLVWRPAPDALRYAVEVVDSDGRLVFGAATRDTVMALPDTLALAVGQEYRWWVLATRADARQVRSRAERFLIQLP